MPDTAPPPVKPDVEPKPSRPAPSPEADPSPFEPKWPADRPLPQPKGNVVEGEQC